MSSLLTPVPHDSTEPAAVHVEARVSDHIRTFLANLLPYPQPRERRCDVRYPFPFLITLTPVGQDNVTPVHEPITVVGKSVSARGIGFYHQHLMPFRRVIITLGNTSGTGLSVLTELLWCRCSRHGWYDSGGRFLELVSAPRAS